MVFLGFVTAVFLNGSQALAETTSEELKTELQSLKERLTQLEIKVAEREKAPASGVVEERPTLLIPNMTEGIELSGFIDSLYSYNFNQPDTLVNRGRLFDYHPNSYNINVAKLVIQKGVSPDSRAGFLVDLYWGRDSQIITPVGLGKPDDEFALQQAYAECLIPAGNVVPGLNDVDLKVGQFMSLLGTEYNESKDNWNSSQGFLSAFATPSTHTGAMATYTFNNGWDVSLGVANGWDVTDDVNNAKTILTHFGMNAIPMPGDSELDVQWNGAFGAEQAANDHSYRYETDIIVVYRTPWKPLTLMYNFGYTSEEDFLFSDALMDTADTANWYGHAFYARIDVNEQWSFSGRGELFYDTDGVLIVPGTATDYWEITGTLEFRPWKNTITRLEYRYDSADHDVFFNDNAEGILTNHQSTLSGEVILTF